MNIQYQVVREDGSLVSGEVFGTVEEAGKRAERYTNNHKLINGPYGVAKVETKTFVTPMKKVTTWVEAALAEADDGSS